MLEDINMHKSSYEKMNWFKSTFLDKYDTLNILDVGSLDLEGNYNYKSIFNEHNWNYVGLDYESGNNVDIVVEDIYNWFEINDNTFDVVISGQFLGNLPYFWLTMVQIERVLKDGGYTCIIVPTKCLDDNNRLNCYQFFETGLEYLAKYVDLDIINISTNDIKPWYDSCLVARKKSDLFNINNVENKINHVESKLDRILNFIR